MYLQSIQPVIKIGTRNFNMGKLLPARKADNLTANCEQIV
jgi:hypothetical protein